MSVPIKPIITRTTREVLKDEAALIAEGRRLSGEAHPAGPTALCLSGGGIRSAAFCLGVLQNLAQADLLRRFDYLSTVSGGGYIGTWLQALIHYRGMDGAMRALRQPDATGSAAVAPQTSPMSFLRRYTNYLTPNPGLTSLDVWTDFVLYIRNVLLNWIVFLPLLLMAVIGPILMRTLLWTAQDSPLAQRVFLIVAGVGAVWATYCSALGLPNHRLRHSAEPPEGNIRISGFSNNQITWLILAPYCCWVLAVPVGLPQDPRDDVGGVLPWVVIVYFVAVTTGYVMAAIVQTMRRDANRRLFSINAGAWLIASVASSSMLWIGFIGIRSAMTAVGNDGNTLLVIVAPIWLSISNALHAAVFVGIRRDGRLFDLDREWLARLSALKLRATCLWAGLCFASIGVSAVLLYLNDATKWHAMMAALSVSPLAAGPLVAWIGKEVRTEAAPLVSPKALVRMLSTAMLLDIGGAIFMVGLFAWLGVLMQKGVLGPIQDALGALWSIDWTQFKIGMLVVQALVFGVLATVILTVTQRVNVNRFSMHALYRNRLTRAFLGSAHGDERRPDEFTNFDPNDNFALSRLRTAHGLWPLFPVINMTLNLTASGRTDWTERKAAAFVATPIHCGSDGFVKRNSRPSDGSGVYVDTARYAGAESEEALVRTDAGLTVATAMTISGAAVSPSWGYHSSPLTAFLMTLFNVRLGAWLPNPAVVTDPARLALSRPERAVRSLLGDLLGMTNGTDASIYLTDGGHFENLGLYEMFRRRCRLILVVDAGQDGDCLFEDLGNAIRKARIDLGTEVTFKVQPRMVTRAAKASGEGSPGYAVATVAYDDLPGEEALLLYLKPSILPDMPADALSYALRCAEFPHESTLDQWFSESQFESYRRLGAYQMQTILAGGPDVNTLTDLFDRARANAEGLAAP